MTIPEAVQRLRDTLDLNPPRLLIFGEQHQTEDSQSSFREFFLEAVLGLQRLGYSTVCVEINHYANSDFQQVLSDNLSLAEYKHRWAPTGAIASKFKDGFYQGLRRIHDTGCNVAFINQVRDPGRDRFMARKLLELMPEDGRAIFFCGYGHAAVRPPAERNSWTSAAELILQGLQSQIYSVAEISRAMFLHYEHDSRILHLLNGMAPQIGLALSEEIPQQLEFVLSRQRIGHGTRRFVGFKPQTITLRFRHFNAFLFDTNKFILPVEEDNLRGRTQNWQ